MLKSNVFLTANNVECAGDNDSTFYLF